MKKNQNGSAEPLRVAALNRAILEGPAQKQRPSGMALVLVLGMLVLVAVLVVAFLSSVSTELQSAKTYAGGSDARTLADSAVNVVIAQIQEATSQPTKAWASQPGMIRTYNSAGDAEMAYKLYSSGDLQPAGDFDALARTDSEVPANWAVLPNIYTDLNEPVSSAGSKYYPIISPAAVHKDVSGGPGDVALDGSTGPIEGCFIDTTNPVVGDEPTHVPMPVQWLYILKSGDLAAMNPVTGKIPIVPATLPDKSANTVVGRVAFWTDDESCKVNINTASEGTFWDRPWVRGNYEANSLNRSMPVQNEFQRFPGHPAMTSLSTILPQLGGSAANNETIYGIIPRVSGGGSVSGSVITTQQSSAFPTITPDSERLFASVDEFLFQPARGVNPFTQNEIEKARFFLTANSRSPDVNLFNKPRITLWPLQKDPNPGNNAPTRTAKDKLIAFCSTIGSGAGAKPYYFERYNAYNFEENLRPASASNWTNKQSPIPSSQSATMDWNNTPRNRELFSYLQWLTSNPIPGLGGRLLAKYPNSRDQILVEALDYIRSTVNPQTTVTNSVGSEIEYFYAPGYKKNQSPAHYNVIGQGQVVPLRVDGSNGSVDGQGFGRITSIKQAVLVFYASDPSDVKTKPATTGVNFVADPQKMNESPMKMRAALLLDPFTVTPGPPSLCANLRYRVTWATKDAAGNEVASFSKVNGADLRFPQGAVSLLTARDQDLNWAPMGGIEYPFKYYEKPNSGMDTGGDHFDLPKKIGVPTVGSSNEEEFYPFISDEITVPGIPVTVPANPNLPFFAFEGGDLKIEIFPGYAQNPNMNSPGPNDCIQTIWISFPPETIHLPRPELETQSATETNPDGSTYTTVKAHPYTDFNARLAKPGIEPGYSHSLKPIIRGNFDTVRSVEVSAAGPSRGDLRLIAGLSEVPPSFFAASPDYGTVVAPTNNNLTLRSLHNYRMYPAGLNGSASNVYAGYCAKPPAPPTSPITNAKIKNAVNNTSGFDASRRGKLVASATYRDDRTGGGGFPIVPNGLNGATMRNGADGDWDTGVGRILDGAYINPADQGNNSRYFSYFGIGTNPQTWMPNETGSSYSPTRQISSAVSFGSLPTGIIQNNQNASDPWQTLLFCKNPAAGAQHPGFGISLNPSGGTAPPFASDDPADHCFLDFFTMPVVEPYAISEPFSTAGKVNMNYQIVPFTYLTRNSAVRSVLKSTCLLAIPTADAANYKQANTADYRYTINANENGGTLEGFERRFLSGDIFRSASEICDIFLVPGFTVNSSTPAPGSPSYSTMNTWWTNYKLTGDNVREQPYGHIYPRLTTKSNTFTVHVRAQALKKTNRTANDAFVDGLDQVTGEYRGSFVIQRTLDPNSDSLIKPDPDPNKPGEWVAATELEPDAMVGPYKFRVLSSKRFAP